MVNVVVVDPSTERRLHLLQALKGCETISSVAQYADIGAAHHAVARGSRFELAFLSSRLKDPVHALVRACQSFGKKTAFITLHDGRIGAATVARRMMEGFSGVLLEPFSFDALETTIKIAHRVQQQRREEQQRRAITLLVREICDQLDYVAKLRRAKNPANIGMQLLHEMCEVLTTLDDDARECYFEILLRSVEDAKPPVEIKREPTTTIIKHPLPLTTTNYPRVAGGM